MIAIHSFFKNTEGIRSDIDIAKKQANLSCKFLKKNKYTTILYTEKNLVDSFKHINYDNIYVIDIKSIYEDLPKNFWAASKLIACSLTNEPYFHIDMDLFLIENHLEKMKSLDFFVFHQEPWYKKYTSSMSEITKLWNYITPESLNYNNAIFGGKKYNDINKNIKDLIQNVIINNLKIDAILRSEQHRTDTAKCVFIEQYLLDNLIKKELNMNNIPLVIEESKQTKNISELSSLIKKYNLIHIWVHKYAIESVIGVEEFVDMLEKRYSHKHAMLDMLEKRYF